MENTMNTLMVVDHMTHKNILDDIFSSYSGPDFAIRLWDGWRWTLRPNQPPVFTLVFRGPTSFYCMLFDANEWTLGAAFIDDDLDVDGDLIAAFSLVEHVLSQPLQWQYRLMQRFAAIGFGIQEFVRSGRKHSASRDKMAIAYHYDQPPEFYRPWLGRSLVYSCAYFRNEDDSLDVAQDQKVDYICQKLRLQPGDKFLDIGCGWGSLIMHAASRYQALSHGITISQRQTIIGNKRINEANLQERCRIELQDYRELSGNKDSYDKIASIGMFEHVGESKLPSYFQISHRILKPGGVLLNHGIARSENQHPRKLSFMDRYVFPDGELVSISKALQAAEQVGFEVRDVENLREHYAKTLRRWLKGLEEHKEMALSYVSKSTYRIWKLYLAGSVASFERGDLGLYQTLLSRPDHGRSHMPLTRQDWYTQA